MTAAKAPRRYPGKIDQLPVEFRDTLAKLMADGWTKVKITKELNKELKKKGKGSVSRQSVNRYTLRMEKEGRKIREARLAAEQWSKTVGSTDSGEIDAYLCELVRTLAIDHAHAFSDTEGEVELKEISDLALAVQRLIGAQEKVDKRIASILAKTAKLVSKEIKSAGLSPETVEIVRRKILGIV